MADKQLVVAGKAYDSRLLVGTGKYRDFDETRRAIEASGAQIVTVAIRRTNIGQNAGEPNLLEVQPPSRYPLLPKTAGCYTAQDAVRTLRLARELLDGHSLVKLEVLGDAKTLYPHMPETLEAARTLVAEGFQVMAYCSDDPIMAKQLEELGCVAVMPLASLIGSGMGIVNPYNLQIIIDHARVPVLVDAGIGTASDAAIAMELGCDGVLMNTAIAKAKEPVRMARAMKLAVEAGREALRATEVLVAEGFKPMVYCTDDPIGAKQLEEAGAVAVMPLGAPIGSGLGIQNRVTIRLIVEGAKVPVLVDAGVGTASDAAVAMELGCDGVLMNTAIAEAKDPVAMARAMRLAVEAGRLAYRAGRMGQRRYADPSSPLAGLI